MMTALMAVMALATAACASSSQPSNESAGSQPPGASESSQPGSDSTAEGPSSVTLKFGGILPKTHNISVNFTQYFIEKVGEAAKAEGKTLTIELFPDGQLGKAADEITNINNGVFDMGLVASPYDPSHMPLSDAFNLPFMAPNAEILAKAYYQVLQDHDSAIYKADFAKNKITPVAAFALPTYQIALTSEITGPESLKGKKIRSGGGVQNDIIKALGGTPVTLTTPEQYEGLQRGVIDGGIFNTPSMIDNKTAEVLKSFTTNVNVAGFNGAIGINQDTWSSLPEWAQKILTTVGKDATDHYAGMLPQLADDANAELVSKYKLSKVEFPSDQLDELEKMLAPVAESWVSQVTDRGADGKAALDEAKAAIADQK